MKEMAASLLTRSSRHMHTISRNTKGKQTMRGQESLRILGNGRRFWQESWRGFDNQGLARSRKNGRRTWRKLRVILMRLCLLMEYNVSCNGRTRGLCSGFVLGSLYCMTDEGVGACFGPRSVKSCLLRAYSHS